MNYQNSQANMLVSVIEGILTDYSLACAYPDVECSRDIARLHQGVRYRGLGFLTLDLPALDDFLTLFLRIGKLPSSTAFSRRRSSKDQRPRFLWALWCRVADADGSLKQDADPFAIFCLRSIFCVGKKLKRDCSPARINHTVGEYYAIERSITSPSLNWDSDNLHDGCGAPGDVRLLFTDLDVNPDSGQMFDSPDAPCREIDIEVLRRLDRVCQIVGSSFGEFNSLSGEEDAENGSFRHGPGAVSDAGGNHYKYAFPHWPKKLDALFPYDWCGSATLTPTDYPSVHEPPSKLICVPKTQKGPRLIAAEPISHQWAQQKVASFLAARMKSSFIGNFIALDDQSRSKELARLASIRGDLATVDLSSASDRLSCWHVERLFQSNYSVLEACHACRTRWIRDDISHGPSAPEYIRLRKFAAMGSALTFPVQSIFFLCCALASAGAHDRKSINDLVGKVRVFGDDIVIPVDAYAVLRSLLTSLGLKINENKTFATGLFRESCGGDYWSGHDVTPVKPKTVVPHSAEDVKAVVDTMNNFFTKGLWHAAAAFESTVGRILKDLPILGNSSADLGLFSFCGSRTEHLRKRWNGKLHRQEVRVATLVSSNAVRPEGDYPALLQWYTERPSILLPKWTAGRVNKRSATLASRWVDHDQLCS